MNIPKYLPRGIKAVISNGDIAYTVRIMRDYKRFNLGTFMTLDSALLALAKFDNLASPASQASPITIPAKSDNPLSNIPSCLLTRNKDYILDNGAIIPASEVNNYLDTCYSQLTL